MKQLFILMTVATFIGVTSFKEKSKSSFIAELNSNFVKVKDNLYFSKYETSNKDYKQFLSSLKQTGRIEEYRSNLLDTAKWATDESSNRPLVVYYHSHPSYDKYPVVTVKYESVINYSRWLTDTYNADPSRKFKKVLFRLPTENEWIYAATAGKTERSYSWDGNQIRNKKGEYLANIKRINEANISFDPTTNNYKVVLTEQEKRVAILAEKQSFYANEFGIYNMIGNAAEMIQEQGRAKGGSYNDAGFDVRVHNDKKYSQASPEIGFRLVMEIVEN